MEQTQTIHFAIVEDDPLALAWIQDSIKSHPDWHITWAESCFIAATKRLREDKSQIDVLLVDLGLPDGSGLDVISLAAILRPQTQTMVVSVFGDEQRVFNSIKAGAKGYLLKGSNLAEFNQQIQELLEGGSPMSPGIARLLLDQVRHSMRRTASPVQGENLTTETNSTADMMADKLSSRELEAIGYLARGYSYAEVARLSTTSVNTVKTHIKRIYEKLQVENRTEAIFEARQRGLIPL